MTFDDVLFGNLQVYTHEVCMHGLAAGVTVNEHRAEYPSRPKLSQVSTGAQQGVPFVQHVIDHQQGGIRQFQVGQLRVFGELCMGMQEAEVVGVAFDLDRVERQWRGTTGQLLQVQLQTTRQRLTSALNPYQYQGLRRYERQGLMRHFTQHAIEILFVIQANA